MKKLLLSLSLLIALVLIINSNSFAQKKAKPFSGIVVYDVKYEGTLEPAMLSQLPTEITTKISGNKMKVETAQSGMFMTQIVNGDDKKLSIIYEMGPQKIYVTLSDEELKLKNTETPKPVIKLLTETKLIAGYTCKKAEIISKNEYDEETISYVFYSEELGNKAINFGNKEMEEIEGLPMEYNVVTEEFSQIFTVKEVKVQKIKDTEFMIPADAQELPADQKQMLLDMMGGK